MTNGSSNPGEAVIVQDILSCLDSPARQRPVRRDPKLPANRRSNSLDISFDGPDDDEGAISSNDAGHVSESLFELANASEIGYRVRRDNGEGREDLGEDGEEILIIHQDASACGRHTGGIVWETCYALLEYLSASLKGQESGVLGRVLEVGAGCGLLGQALAARGLARSVVMTEVDAVLPNLRANAARNAAAMRNISKGAGGDAAGSGLLGCCRLDWLDPACVQQSLEPRLLSSRFDTILGTDVIFAPDLVDPLLETCRTYSHPTTQIYLCVQIRCPESHRMFLERAPSYGFRLQDFTQKLCCFPSCSWAMYLECRLLLLTPLTVNRAASGK
jgi:hypothetical protein